MAVGVDLRGESYGLLIDEIGEVLRLPDDGREENPVNLDPRMAKLAGGVHPSMASSWSCSTSTACSKSRLTCWRHKAAGNMGKLELQWKRPFSRTSRG